MTDVLINSRLQFSTYSCHILQLDPLPEHSRGTVYVTSIQKPLSKQQVVIICLLNNLTTCHTQESITTTPASHQTHWQRPAHATRNTVTRWKANQSPATSAVTSSSNHNSDYKELMTNLHDRVSLLVTMHEDLRKRFDSIEKKITQFEASNLARMDSMAVQQMDFSKRMDITEHIQRLTRRGVDQLLGEFEEYMKTLNHTQITDNRNHTNDNSDNGK
ncbi:hypothetical protein EVAR_72557_1 [Eumeta japonica]|uniref:Uncharacterized protein n=1 Tax=Eumeta variegata TaxID=151549 RepID=A0A4C2A797_EUMVA|nr:hypothetical protein EVAR_72557_1 [Eumeta japonica]